MGIIDYQRGQYYERQKKGMNGKLQEPRAENPEVEAFLEAYGLHTNHHYVDNQQFYKDIVKFREECERNRKMGLPRPNIPQEIVDNIILISTHLAYRPNFSGYTFRDDMVHAGIENCVRYIENFDPAKSQNPFAYFTSVCWYAFVRLIKESKKQSIIKGKLMMNYTHDDALEIDSDVDARSVFQDMAEQMSTYIEAADQFDKKQAAKEAERAKLAEEKAKAKPTVKSVLDAVFEYDEPEDKKTCQDTDADISIPTTNPHA